MNINIWSQSVWTRNDFCIYLSEEKYCWRHDAHPTAGTAQWPRWWPHAAVQRSQPDVSRSAWQHGVPRPHQWPLWSNVGADASAPAPRPAEVEVRSESGLESQPLRGQGHVRPPGLPPLLRHPLHQQAHHLPVQQQLLRGLTVLKSGGRGIEYYYSSNVINFQTLVLQMILPRYLLTHFIRFV